MVKFNIVHHKKCFVQYEQVGINTYKQTVVKYGKLVMSMWYEDIRGKILIQL